MPEGESVALARVREDDAKQGGAFPRRAGGEIKFRQSAAKRSSSVLKIRRAGADLRARLTDGASGNEGFTAVQLETHPAHGGAQEAGTGIIHVQGVDAAEIHGDGGRSIHDKLAGRGPDGGVNRAALERKPLPAGPVRNETEARVGVDFDAARFIQRDGGPRRAISHKSLPNSQFPQSRFLAERMPSNPRRAFQTSDVPRWPGISRGS